MTGDGQQASKCERNIQQVYEIAVCDTQAKRRANERTARIQRDQRRNQCPPFSRPRYKFNGEQPMARQTGAYIRPGSAIDKYGSPVTVLVATDLRTAEVGTPAKVFSFERTTLMMALRQLTRSSALPKPRATSTNEIAHIID